MPLEGFCAVVLSTPPTKFGAFLAKDRAAMATLVREAGIVAD